MTIARTAAAIHLAYARACAGGFMRKAMCLRPSYVRACTRAWGTRVATVELRSNCAKLRISVGDELRDLQYNCTALSLFLSPRCSSPVRVAERITAPVRDMCSPVCAYLQYVHVRV